MDEKNLASGEKEIHIVGALFDRRPSSEYLADWEAILAAKKEEEPSGSKEPLLLVRLCREWLALPTAIVKDVVDIRPVHVIPHKTGKILRGTVNIGGQLKLCVSVENLLEIEKVKLPPRKNAKFIYERMVVIRQERQEWVFAVDEVYGICHVDRSEFENVPVTVTKSAAGYIEAIFNWGGIHVGILQDELLFYSLRRAV